MYHRDFAQGGVLELWLGPEPNKAWGKFEFKKVSSDQFDGLDKNQDGRLTIDEM
jgi:putative alpha-1,2-mannosidase